MTPMVETQARNHSVNCCLHECRLVLHLSRRWLKPHVPSLELALQSVSGLDAADSFVGPPPWCGPLPAGICGVNKYVNKCCTQVFPIKFSTVLFSSFQSIFVLHFRNTTKQILCTYYLFLCFLCFYQTFFPFLHEPVFVFFIIFLYDITK